MAAETRASMRHCAESAANDRTIRRDGLLRQAGKGVSVMARWAGFGLLRPWLLKATPQGIAANPLLGIHGEVDAKGSM